MSILSDVALTQKELRLQGSSCTICTLCQAPGRKARLLTLTPSGLQCLLFMEGTATSQQPTGSVHTSPIVTGTIEWPTIKNTQLTLFDLMDHLQQGLPSHFLAPCHHLTLEEMDEVMQFLTAHEAAIEQSYAPANARAAA